MFNRKIIWLCLIICVIFSISAVGAAEVDDDSMNDTALTMDVVSQSNDLSSNSQVDNEILSDGDEGSFSQLNDKINEGGTEIILGQNYTYVSSDSSYINGIVIPSTVTKIDGQGKVVINGSDSARIFNIARGSEVTLTGITFINGNALSNGGAIYSEGKLTVDNCKFIDNYAGKDGAAVYLNASYSIIKNSEFRENIAGDDGGAIYWIGDWGTIYNIACINNKGTSQGTSTSRGGTICLTGSNVVISKSSFATSEVYQNTAASQEKSDGGTMMITGDYVNVTDTVFSDSHSSNFGGTIHIIGNNALIKNCTFDKSNAPYGGIIYVQGNEANITESNFKNSNATLGGAIFVNGEGTDIVYSNFTNNNASNQGGAIYWASKSSGDTIKHSNFITNHALGGSGGAIYWGSEGNFGVILNSTFTANTAQSYGGGICWSQSSNGTIENSTFTRNIAHVNGGALSWDGTDGYLRNCTFDSNYAYGEGIHQNYAGGGAISWNAKNGEFYKCTFINNTSPYHAGAVIGQNSKNLVVNYCQFINNSAPSGAGGVFYLETSENVVFYNSNFTSNSAGGDAGCIYFNKECDYSTIENCTFRENYAGETGAVNWNINNGLIYNSTFIKNYLTGATTDNHAGAITFGGNNNTIEKCNFIGNTIDESTMSKTHECFGGAIYYSASNSKIIFSNFTNNHAAEMGGAIYVTVPNAVLYNLRFNNNTASGSGGAICVKQKTGAGYPSNCSIYNSYFEDNEANYGGALYLEATLGKLYNSTFVKNNGYEGGAVRWSGNGGYLHDCNFTDNMANRTSAGSWTIGGTIYWNSGSGIMNNVIINQSYCYKYGGAIALFSTSQLNNITIINSTAQTNAGGMYIKSSNSVISNTNFYNCSSKNTKGGGGGSIMCDGASGVKLINVSIINSTSATHGGAIYWTGSSGNLTNVNISNAVACSRVGEDSNGGALYWTGSSGTLNNVKITDSSAFSYVKNSQNLRSSYGGALYWTGSDALITKLTVINASTQTYGGGLYWTVSGNITESSFTNCTVSQYGGAIYATAAGTLISKSNFTSNNASEGGAIYTTSGSSTDYINTIVITNSSFKLNYAKSEGGAIYSGFIGGKILYSNFTNNSAGSNGGAIAIANGNQEVGNCIFENNTAAKLGGAIYVKQYLDITIHNSTFKKSSAYNGGAIYNLGSSGASVTISNDTFIDNTASHNGGAVYYIVDNYQSRISVIYRDYDNFDGRGIIDSNGRTTVDMESDTGTYPNVIFKSYFKNNQDYLLNASASVSNITNLAIVTLYDPRDADKKTVKIVINVTFENDVRTIEIDKSNYDDYLNIEDNTLNVNFYNLTENAVYNVTVTFEDGVYLKKTTNFTFYVKNYTDVKGDFTILQELIDTAIKNNQKELNLTRNYVFTIGLDKGCMHINSTLTINGRGYSINALDQCRIFNITADNVILSGLSFINGNVSGNHSDDFTKGGAINWMGANGQLINSQFRDNYAEIGGGLYINSTASNLKIISCSFIDNEADLNGGAIDCNASGMNLTHTTFESNYAGVYGAALCREHDAAGGFGYNNTFIRNHADVAGAALAWINATSININRYTFTDNTAGVSGGAIYVGEGSGNCVINNSYFSGNNITDTTGGHGGAIEWYAQQGTVINSTFINNNAHTGGAIYVGSDSGHINIYHSGFIRNNAYSVGGAIDLAASSVNVNNSYFRENTALEGGAIYVGGTGENNMILDSYFTNNNATSGRGGAISWVASAGSIFNSNFTRNSAEYGGAVYIGGSSSNSEINNVLFDNNSATYNGGAIDWNATGGRLYNTTFINNYAGQYGAALCREVGATGGSGKNNTFISNHAGIAGAALAWIVVDKITIDDYKFINNTAGAAGGAIFVGWGSDNCTIKNSLFEGNYITNDEVSYGGASSWISLENGGGAIAWIGSNGKVLDSNFTRNNATYGGAIYVGSISGNTQINNSIFTDNHAVEQGGAIYLTATAVNVNNSAFYNNTAIHGGALHVGGVGTNNNIYSSVFEGNNATGGHGGAVNWLAAAGHIIDTNFTKNYADYGGAIYLNGVSSNSTISNVIFKNNTAVYNGGAIDCNSERMNLTNTLFDSNYAGEYGAALCREPEATHGFGEYNNFTNNHAGIAGAALAWMGVKDININHYIFINNTADKSGGAIYVSEGSDNCVINNSYFERNSITNTTGGHGGAVDIVGNNATIINSNFTLNSAMYGGAIFAGNLSGDTHISNVAFTYNHAELDAGAVQIRGSGVILNETKFYNNTAVRNGGAIYVGGTGVNNAIYSSEFTNNSASSHGGAVDWRASAGEIIDSNFTLNSAEYGGAIYLNGISANSIVRGVIFANNSAVKNGGAIDCNATKMNLTNTLFEDNYAGEYGAALCRETGATGGFGYNNTFTRNEAGIAGAALAWMDVSDINIDLYNFTDNIAGKSGGAIYVSENSNNCIIKNSYFSGNNVTLGRGGAIDWLGSDGNVINTTFKDSLATYGGAIHIGVNSNNTSINNSTFDSCHALVSGGAILWYGDNGKVNDTKFTASFALEYGGAIAGFDTQNMTISNSEFNYNSALGPLDSSDRLHGEGGAIYWVNGNNLNISNTTFKGNEAHSNGGALSAINCNDSTLYNVSFSKGDAFRNGGAISYVNSTNLTIELGTFNNLGAVYSGGAVYLDNVDAQIRNSSFNNTKSAWDYGGAISVNGNVSISNSTFDNYLALESYGCAVHFKNGTSSMDNNRLNGKNPILISKDANITLTGNNITGLNPNKDTKYLEDNTPAGARYFDYAVWNDGELFLEKNNFSYVIFNNGTITSHVYIDMLDNETWNATWKENFTFWASIKDDNDNSIISVHTLDSYNDHREYENDTYFMPYNKVVLPVIYQGVFIIYGNDSGFKNFTMRSGIIKVRTPTNINITTQTQDGKVIITAKVSQAYNATFTGNVSFRINNDVYTAVIGEDGIATWTLNNLTAGTYTVTAAYTGDDWHIESQNSTVFSVDSRMPWIEIQVLDIVYGQTAVVNVTTNATGRVYINVNGRHRIVNITDGFAQFNVTGLTPGNYTAVAVIMGNGYFNSTEANKTFKVYKLNTTISVNQTTPIKWGEDKLINVTVAQNATGFIKIKINGTEYYLPIDKGIAKFNVTGLYVGLYENITVEYLGSDYYNSNSTNITFEVVATDDYNITVKVDNIKFGENATVVVTLPISATGNVTIWIDDVKYENVTIINGTATLITPSNLTVGSHMVNVTYMGNEIYAPKSQNGKTFEVTSTDDWTINITVDAHEYGKNTTFTVKLPENISKNVTLEIEGANYTVNLTNGEGSLTLNNISAGTHNAIAYYEGDANYSAKSDSAQITIAKATPMVNVVANPIYVGQNATINVTVSGNATGYVTVYVGSQVFDNQLLDANHKVQVNVTGLAYGTHNVVAFYKGDNNYTSNINYTTVNVLKIPTQINITVGDKYFVDESFNITVKNTTAVNVTINGKPYTIANGNITINANELAAGHYVITATIYEGGKYSGNVTTKEFDIVKHAGEVRIEISGSNPHAVGSNFTITVNNNTAVNVTVNGKSYNVVNNKVVINTAELPIGEYIVTATIYENNVYLANSTSKTFNIVRNASDLSVVATPDEVMVGKNTTITVNMVGVESGKVLIEVNGYNYTADINNGVAVLTISLPVGNYTAKAYFLGDENHSASDNESIEFNVLNKTVPKVNITAPVSVEIDNNITFTVNMTGNGTLTVKVNGEIITKGADGKYHFNKTGTAGNYTITAELAGNDYYFEASNSTTFKVYKHASEIESIAATPTVIVGKNTTITVTMDGNETGNVIIEVGGHNYTVAINGEHKVILVVALPAGNYTAKAYYLGDDKYNETDKTSQKFNVTAKKEANITISVPKVTIVGNNVTISITNSTPIIATLNGEDITLQDGKYIFNAIDVGNYTVIARSSETGEYYAGFNSTVFNVVKRDAYVNIVIEGSNLIEIDNNITFTVNINSNGTLVVKVNSNVVTVGADGKYHFNGTATGNYTITAEVAGNGYYGAVFNSTTFKVIKHQGKVNITVENRYEIGTVFDIVIGNNTIVNVTINGVKYNVDGGKVVIDTDKLAAGNYTVIATVFESDKYYGNVTSQTLEIFKHTAVIKNITVPAAGVVMGKNATIIVNMDNVTSGYVLIEVDGHNYTVEIINKVANLTVELPTGEYYAVAYYMGDANYTSATPVTSAKFKVLGKEGVLVNITIIGSDVIEIDNNITFNVTSNSNGTLVVKVNGKVIESISNNQYRYNGTVEGNYTITAEIAGNEYYVAGFNSTMFKVIKHNAKVNIIVNDKYEIESNFIIEIVNNTSVNVTINGIKYDVVDGKVAIDTAKLAAGNYTVIATVFESDKYYGNVTSKVFEIIKHNAEIKNITVLEVKIDFGKNATITVNMGNVTEGTVLIEVGGHNYTVEIIDKVAVLNVTLPVGVYTAKAYYIGDDKYGSATSELSPQFTVADKKAAIIIINAPKEVEIDNNITFTVTNSTPVNVTVNGVSVYLKDGKYTYNATSAGTATIIARSAETDLYHEGYNSTTFNVYKHNSTVEVLPISNHLVGDNFTITVNSNTEAIVMVNGKEYTVVDGKVVIDTTVLPAGEYIINAIVKENDKYLSNSSNATFNISKRNAEVKIVMNDKYEIESEFTIAITNATTVNVTINGEIYLVKDNKVVINTTELLAGNYTVTATIFESDKYYGNITSKTFEIYRHNVVIESVDVPVEDTHVGDNVTISVNMGNVTEGTLLIEVGGHNYTVEIIDKIAVLNVELPVGVYTAKAYFLGDDKYNKTASDASSEFKVIGKRNATVEINALGIVEVENNIIFTVANSTPVNVTVNGVPVYLKDGVYTYNATVAGDYTIIARSGETDDYYAGFDSAMVKVIKHNSTVKVDAVDNWKVGDNFTITVTNSSSAVVTVNGKEYDLVGGKVVIDTTVLPAGEYIVTAAILENDKYYGNSSTVSFNITKHAQSINITVNKVYYVDEDITMGIENDTEAIVTINGKTYAVTGGIIRIAGGDLPAGHYIINAVGKENNMYEYANSTNEFDIIKYNSTVKVTANPIEVGQIEVIMIVDMPTDATGYVIVNVNGTEYVINLTDAKEVAVPINKAGTYNVVATYLGDDKYLSNTSTTSFNATKVSGNVTIEVENATVGGDVNVKVTVPDDATGNVTVKIGNTTKTVPVTGGENTITISNVTEGTHEVNVTYSGDGKYDSKTLIKNVTVTTSINARDLTRAYNSPYDFEAEFLGKDGHVLANTEVTIQINGKQYTVKTDDNGIARLTETTLGVGEYNVTLINPVTGESITRHLTVVKRIVENKDLTMDFDSGKYYVVRAIDDDGTPVGAGEVVGFLINGIRYVGITDAKGYAKLQINLNPKTYTITAQYRAFKVSNKVKVKQTLKLVKKTVKVKKGKKLVLKAKFKWSNGKAAKGKKIVFKFKGKKYSAKTNKKGIAKVTIKKKVTKKLKKGKTYKYTATCKKNAVKGKVKVKK